MSKEVIFVASSTPVKSLASSITRMLDEGKDIELRGIGAGANSQAIKAVASARVFVNKQGKELLIRPCFDTIINKDGEERTVCVFNLLVW